MHFIAVIQESLKSDVILKYYPIGSWHFGESNMTYLLLSLE